MHWSGMEYTGRARASGSVVKSNPGQASDILAEPEALQPHWPGKSLVTLALYC